MEIFGIQFAPFNIPLQRRLQTLAAAAQFITLAYGGFIAFFLTIYLLFTRFWWLTLLYIGWIYLDRQTAEQGGRVNESVRNWNWWIYLKDYFPLHLTCVPGLELDPKRNYLFCCFPHGILSTGVFNAFGTNAADYKKYFPFHTTRVVTLNQHYNIPFFRELALSLGGIAASAKAISYNLNQPKGGFIVTLMPGGVSEVFHSRPGKYRIILKKRLGFIKVALRCGSPLVPVISFGETDIFNQLEGPILRRFQEFLRKVIGMAPVILMGRGFFQYTFGTIPQRRPITTVVGHPIDVEKIENPSSDQIHELHAKFTEALKKLFEEQKHLYIENYEDTFLEIE